MNVLHVTNTFSEGGVDTLLLTLIPALNVDGNKTDLLVLKKNDNKLAAILENKGFKVYSGKYKSLRNPLNIYYLSKIIKNYDIVHVHLFPSQYFVALAKFLFRLDVVLVTTEHITYNKRRDIKLLRGVEKFIYKKYAKILCVSKKAEENLFSWIRNKNILTVYNGIDILRFQRALPYKTQDLGLNEDSKIAIMVARFFGQKDQETVIRALKYLPENIKVLFCGSGTTYLEKCKMLVTELNLQNQVLFLGNRNDVDRLLKTADITILSSFYEGLPMSILEYFAAGKPVVASDIDGVRELVEGNGFLFEIGDEKALAEYMKILLSDLSLNEEYSQRSRLKSSEFDEKIMIENHKKVYEEVLNTIKK